MKHVLRYGILAVILVGLGWQVYSLLNPEPEPEPEPNDRVLAVGDPESDIQPLYGKPIGVSEKSGITTYYFSEAQVDAQDGAVAAIRDRTGVKGSMEIGGRKVVVDQSLKIKEP